MSGKKSIFVLIFSLLLFLFPRGIYWNETQYGHVKDIACYLFKLDGNGLVRNMDIIKEPELLVMLSAYGYFIVGFVLLIEYVYNLKKKHLPALVMEWTARIFVIVAILQIIGTVFYADKYFLETDSWTWIFEIGVIQLIVAIGFCVVFCGDKSDKKIESDKLIWKNLLYAGLGVFSLFRSCFRTLAHDGTDGTGAVWRGRNILFFENDMITQWVFLGGITVLALIIILLLLLLFVDDENRLNQLLKIERFMDGITLLLFAWVVIMAMLIPVIETQTWYFMPDLANLTFISWGCWRLVVPGSKSSGTLAG